MYQLNLIACSSRIHIPWHPIMIKQSDKDTKEDIQKVFHLFDDDQTGHITLRNLRRVAKELGETMSGE